MKKYLPLMVLFLLFTNIVLACPASENEALFVKEITQSSDELTFLSTNLLEPQNHSQLYKPTFPSNRIKYFKLTGSHNKLTISVNGNEISNSEVDTLKTEPKRYNDNAREWGDIPIYEFPGQDIVDGIYVKSEDLKDHNRSIVTLYLDDKLVREFILEYKPAQIYDCTNYGVTNEILFTLIFVIALILIILSVVIFIVIKKRRK